MLLRVTGGMSFVVGALKPAAEAVAWVCGSNPVRTIGGCNSEEMALWPASRTALPRRLRVVPSVPPIEPIDATLPALPLRGWYRLLDVGRYGDSWLGKGNADAERGDVGELLSMEIRGEGADMAEGAGRKRLAEESRMAA